MLSATGRINDNQKSILLKWKASTTGHNFTILKQIQTRKGQAGFFIFSFLISQKGKPLA